MESFFGSRNSHCHFQACGDKSGFGPGFSIWSLGVDPIHTFITTTAVVVEGGGVVVLFRLCVETVDRWIVYLQWYSNSLMWGWDLLRCTISAWRRRPCRLFLPINRVISVLSMSMFFFNSHIYSGWSSGKCLLYNRFEGFLFTNLHHSHLPKSCKCGSESLGIRDSGIRALIVHFDLSDSLGW
jgi:hypothetical protein